MSTVAAGSQGKQKAETRVEVCSVHVGKTLYGVPMTYILEIVGAARPRPVPLAPGYVGGLIHYRGDVLTTVSLRSCLRFRRRTARRTFWCSRATEVASGCRWTQSARC